MSTVVAEENRYCRPVVDDGDVIELVEARHPVIEQQLPADEPYISNTVRLDRDNTQIIMLTGPNMSGKSALLRQTALNVLMAQIGCFVAADSARIGYVDKIFTRVGASDNISLGEGQGHSRRRSRQAQARFHEPDPRASGRRRAGRSA